MESLTLLAMANRPLPAEAVEQRVWPDTERSRVAASLKTYASRLRRKFGDPNAVVFERSGYRLGIPHFVQIGEVNRLARRAQQWEWLPSYLIKS
ncbi:MAG: hypothetical protein IAI50_03090 [Candidatus Eremiobacteraeota bacterium]|nr:hypothetical protein [Candidatus Eremiobacteraeota bacterium]